jgi:hypothetical protein
MCDEPLSVRLPVRVSKSEAAAIDQFQVAEKLGTRAEAIRLLIEIGLDTVSKTGRRFWDKSPEQTPHN